jgi:signal transduction histidine kinase
MSIASHEFRTPLSAILSSNSLVEKYAQLGQTDMMQKHLYRIKSSVKVMVGIIEDFLSLEKLDRGNVEVIPSHFNLVAFCNDIIAEIEPQIKPGQLITYSNRGNSEVYSDKKVLQHILSNLLSNACKYSQEESKIQFTTHVSSETMLIYVEDNGIGIPLVQQEKIFTRFFRAQNAVSIQGTGLGLYICKSYTELLGGTISFTSKPNKGTTFVVEIPQSKT